jgi:hypothetical protein
MGNPTAHSWSLEGARIRRSLVLAFTLVVVLSGLLTTGARASTTDSLRMVANELGSYQTAGPYNVWAYEGDLPPRELPLWSGGPVSLSPNGNVIAYTPFYDNRYHLALTDIFGHHEETIYTPPCLGDFCRDSLWVNRPEWSSNGLSLVFECSSANSGYAICSINKDGTGFRKLVDLAPTNVQAPTYSPDGTKIVYEVSPQAISIANADGSNQHPLVRTGAYGTGLMARASDPAYGPNGQIAFTGCGPWYKKKGQLTCDAGIYVIRDDGTNLTRLTSYGLDENPNWFTSSAGPRIVFNLGPNPGCCRTIASMRPDGTDLRTEGTGIAGPQNDPHFAAAGNVATEMLQRFVPVPRYYDTETYEADAVNEITDNYVAGGTSDETNKLQDQGGVIVATANPDLGWPRLTLDLLAQRYTDGYYTDGDWIDEKNDTHPADAQAMHGSPYYANKIYGRVTPSNSGGYLLSYWMFYYYNNGVAGFGDHEGDWEMVQLEVSSTGAPIRAAYAQHGGGETCDWIHVPRDSVLRPIDYVADGSHANYFSPGLHLNSGYNNDYTSDTGTRVDDLQLIDMSNLAVQPWVLWRGRYGGSGSSPPAPITQGKWDNPTWADSLDGCTEGQTFP